MSGQIVKNIIGLIPAHNEEEGIRKVVSETKKYLETVLVVDDGSADKTVQEAMAGGAIVLRHDQNKGKGAALKTGFDFVLKSCPMADGIISLDGDGQHEPGEIAKFIESFEKNGFDLILGERIIDRSRMPFLRRAGNRLVSGLVSLKVGQKIIDSQSGFRFFSRRFLERLELRSAGYGVETELLLAAAKNKIPIATIPIAVHYRNKNQINFLKDRRIIVSIIKEFLGR